MDDSPSLTFRTRGQLTVIQTSHICDDPLLDTPLAWTLWVYERTTREWIPIFRAVNNDEVTALCDVELEIDRYHTAGDALWVTPKGFPRKQWTADDESRGVY